MSALSGRLLKAPVQRDARDAAASSTDVHAAAEQGTSGGGGALPHAERIQAAFGSHDVGNVQAYMGGAAAEASGAMGAEAYATGDKVAFRGVPSLHTAAHEAAHVIQQRAGVSLSGGVGQAGDRYERRADAVADAVVQGRSAEGLLGGHAGDGGPHHSALQMSISDSLRQIGDAIRHPIETIRGHRQWEQQQRGPDAGGGNPQWLTDTHSAVQTARSKCLSFAQGFRGRAFSNMTPTSDALVNEAHHLETVERTLNNPAIRAADGAGLVADLAQLAEQHSVAVEARDTYMADPTPENQRAFAAAMTRYINTLGSVLGRVPGMNALAGAAIASLTRVNFVSMSRNLNSMNEGVSRYGVGGSQAGEMGDTPLPE